MLGQDFDKARAHYNRPLACLAYKWIQYLESFYQGPCVAEWRERYEEALENAIADRKARVTS